MVQFPTGKPRKNVKLSGFPPKFPRVLPDLRERIVDDFKAPVVRSKVSRPKPARRLYLAYGSNLNKRAMWYRCPEAKSMGRVLVRNARLVFRGVADIEFCPDYAVPCGLWSITPECEKRLDSYEGVAGGLYYKEEIPLDDGEKALVYMMTSDGVYPPSQHYFDVIKQGYQDFRLDHAFLHQALNHSFKQKDPSEATEARRTRQRASELMRKLVDMPEHIAIRRMQMREDNMRRGSILMDETEAEKRHG